MLSLALVVAFGGMARASYSSIIDWMDVALNPDLFVMPSQDIVIRTLRFPPEMADEVAAVPGVERVQAVRNARVIFRQTPVMIVASDMKSLSETAAVPPVEGNAVEMYRQTGAGDGRALADGHCPHPVERVSRLHSIVDKAQQVRHLIGKVLDA